jgi:DNA-binding GntR family transcriptional regulator
MVSTLEAGPTPIGSTQTIADNVYRELKRRLLTGGVSPGEHLMIRSLSAQLGVGFTPTREALGRLADEGALESWPRYYRVPVLTLAQAKELSRVRTLLELELVEHVLPHVTDRHVAIAERIHGEIATANAEKRYSDAVERNQTFHFYIYQLANMPITMAVIEGLWVRSGPSVNYVYADMARPPGHQHGHIAILDALKARDVRKLKAAFEQDIARGLGYIERALKKTESVQPDDLKQGRPAPARRSAAALRPRPSSSTNNKVKVKATRSAK